MRLAANVSAARRELDVRLPGFAILDFNLGNETSADVAGWLQAADVPFLFVTGYGDNVIIPDQFKLVPIARKPMSATSLAARIEAMRRPKD